MKIKSIEVYQLDLPLKKAYKLSGGRLRFECIDGTFICIKTECGLIGWGEGTPWGNTYLPAFAEGIRAAAGLLSDAIIGMDPREHTAINAAMDIALPGHLYAKSPFDIACWDITAQAANVPLCIALGADYKQPIPIASSISTDTPEKMLAEVQSYRDTGYFVHSIKIGSDVENDIARIKYLSGKQNPDEVFVYDVNRAWTPMQAIEVMTAVKNLPHAKFEQPCETLAQCLQVRNRTTHPISIDERLETLLDMENIAHKAIGEIINLKVGRVGGLTKARQIRDCALHHGFNMLVMETGGSVIADTAAVQLALTIPSEWLIGTWLCQDMLSVDPQPRSGARNTNGCADVPRTAGLGVVPDVGMLKPIATYTSG